MHGCRESGEDNAYFDNPDSHSTISIDDGIPHEILLPRLNMAFDYRVSTKSSLGNVTVASPVWEIGHPVTKSSSQL